MTISARIQNKTKRTIYIMGYPLGVDEEQEFPYVLGHISIVSDIGFIILNEDGHDTWNSRLYPNSYAYNRFVILEH